MATPNIMRTRSNGSFATYTGRDRVVLSGIPHNDAAREVAAGSSPPGRAERGRGNVFRQWRNENGNVDLMTLALDLFSRGVIPS